LKKKKKEKEIETPQKVWQDLNKEWNKIFDNFKYFDENNKVMFLNIIIGEAVKFSGVSPLNCLGMFSRLEHDINTFVRQNLTMSMEKPDTRSYVG